MSQPTNVVGGHLVATAVGLLFRHIFPDIWWAAALAVGVEIAIMAALRITHPPAGADPLVVFSADPQIGYLLFPVISGVIVLVVIATAYHRFTGTVCPLKANE